VRAAGIAALAAAALAAGVYLALERRAAGPDPADVLALTRTQLPDLAGGEASLERWRGKVIVVNFWASWCPPCREEIPGLVRIQERFASNGVQVVGIAIDSAAKSRQAAAELGINYPVLVAGLETIDLTRKLGNPAGALPYTLVLDRRGALAATHLGVIPEASLERILAPLLGSSPAPAGLNAPNFAEKSANG
jgi:thiol-disulfide isomerase/thioredoxin